MQTPLRLLLAAGLTLTTAAHTGAQTPPPPPVTPMHRAMPAKAGNNTVPVGQIIGNKKTHVFHVAGDHGSLPAPQNRVIFHSTAEAKAAGYHAAGEGMPGTPLKRQGSPRTGTTSATGRPMPPHALPGTAAPPPPPAPIAPR